MSGYLTTLAGKHVPVRDGFVIGRVAGCDLVIDDNKASRRHARIVVEAGVAEVEDLGSSNGTRLNDKPVTRRVLRDGDRIQIGATVLVYRDGQAPGEAKAVAEPVAFDDDDDLLGDDRPTATPAVAPAPPPAAPPAPAAPAAAAASPFADDDDDLFGNASPAAAPSPAPPPPAATPRVAPPSAAKPPANVVEFADEVVEVRKPAAAPAAKPAAAPAAGPAPSTSGRILQFQKQAGGGGLLGDDLGQVGGGMRALFVLGALALGAGIVWLTIRLVG